MKNLQNHDLQSGKPWTPVSLPTETFVTQECPIYAQDRINSGRSNIQELEGWKKHPPDKEELYQHPKEKQNSDQEDKDNTISSMNHQQLQIKSTDKDPSETENKEESPDLIDPKEGLDN